MAGNGIFISEVPWVIRGINGWWMEIGVLMQRRKREIDAKGRVSIGVELSSLVERVRVTVPPTLTPSSHLFYWLCKKAKHSQVVVSTSVSATDLLCLEDGVGGTENMSVKSQINRIKTPGKERQFISCNGIKNPLVHLSILLLGSYICAFCHEKYNICQ